MRVNLWAILAGLAMVAFSVPADAQDANQIDKGRFIVKIPDGVLQPDGTTNPNDRLTDTFRGAVQDVFSNTDILDAFVGVLADAEAERQRTDPTFTIPKFVIDIEIGGRAAILAQIERERGKEARDREEEAIKTAIQNKERIEAVTYRVEQEGQLVLRVKIYRENLVLDETAGAAARTETSRLIIHELLHAVDFALEDRGLAPAYETEPNHGGEFRKAEGDFFDRFRAALIERTARAVYDSFIASMKATGGLDPNIFADKAQELAKLGFTPEEVIDILSKVAGFMNGLASDATLDRDLRDFFAQVTTHLNDFIDRLKRRGGK